MRDYRSEKMETAEGKGIARRAWEAYTRGADRHVRPVVDSVLGPLVRRWSAAQAVDLSGFWMCWHLHGGFEGLERLGMDRSTIFRKIKRFRMAYGVHPDEFVLPGVALDLTEYWSAVERERKRKKR
jgi:hypothetical protein